MGRESRYPVAMSPSQSPSPIIETFVRAAKKSFPTDQQSILDAFVPSIAKTTSKGDHKRARHCALWAIEKADDKNQSHPRWREIKELHQIWKDTWFGLEFGLADVKTRVAGPPEPLEDVWIQWTEDAVAVATRLGEEDGWDESPWQALFSQLIAIDDQDE
jgi:hypothetical protein